MRAALLLPLVSLSLWIRGFRFTQATLQRFASGGKRALSDGSLNSASPAWIKHRKQIAARMVRAAARRSPKTISCLEESLCLWFLLRRESFGAELRIGARKIAGKFEAHAWVECDGMALNEAEEVHHHYAVFDRVISPVAEAQ